MSLKGNHLITFKKIALLSDIFVDYASVTGSHQWAG
jgi:hypothetical protein